MGMSARRYIRGCAPTCNHMHGRLAARLLGLFGLVRNLRCSSAPSMCGAVRLSYSPPMPDYVKLRDLISHRVVVEYDTGARIVGYVASCRPNEGPVQLVNLSRARIEDADGNIMETHDSLSLCPNVLTGFNLEEGPSGRRA